MNQEFKDDAARTVVYQQLLHDMRRLYRAGGVKQVAVCMAQAIQDNDQSDDIMFMRLNACVYAQDSVLPLVTYLRELIHELAGVEIDVTPQRIELTQNMLAAISANICAEMVTKAMGAARAVSQALGATIDISATHMGPQDNEWKDLTTTVPASTTIH